MSRIISIATTSTRPYLASLRAVPCDHPLEHEHIAKANYGTWHFLHRAPEIFSITRAYDICASDGTSIGICISVRHCSSREWIAFRRRRSLKDELFQFPSIRVAAQELADREDASIKAWARRRRMSANDQMSAEDQAALEGLTAP